MRVLDAASWPTAIPSCGGESRIAYISPPKLPRLLHFPSLGVLAARVLVERGVAGVGVDCPSTDYGAASSFDVHGVFGAAGIPAIENLADLAEVPATGAVLVALPPKIKGGSGGPIRVVALIPKSR